MLCAILMDTYTHHVSDKIDGIDPVIILAKKKKKFSLHRESKNYRRIFFNI